MPIFVPLDRLGFQGLGCSSAAGGQSRLGLFYLSFLKALRPGTSDWGVGGVLGPLGSVVHRTCVSYVQAQMDLLYCDVVGYAACHTVSSSLA